MQDTKIGELKAHKLLKLALLLTIILVVLEIATFKVLKKPVKTTELYVLEHVLREEAEITVVIKNMEGREMRYVLIVTALNGEEKTLTSLTITLPDKAEWEGKIKLPTPQVWKSRVIHLKLYRIGEYANYPSLKRLLIEKPYREIWIMCLNPENTS